MEVKFKVELLTKRLRLRPLCIGDINTTHEYAGDIENTKYMLYLPNESIKETKGFLESVEKEWNKDKPLSYEFAIVLDGLHIGAISISIIEPEYQGEIGWILNKRYWNCGYVSEAAIKVLEFSQKELHLTSVIAQCDWRNILSARVMEKIGMKLIDDKGQRTYIKRDEVARELTYKVEF